MNIEFQEEPRPLRGSVHLEVRKAGRLVEVETDHNLIVAVGRAKLAKLLGGGYSGHITQIGVGTGSAAAADGDTALTDAVMIPLDSTEYDGAKVKFNFTIGTGTANGINIREFGLFFADGTMFSHRVRKSVIGKEDDLKITGYWEIYL